MSRRLVDQREVVAVVLDLRAFHGFEPELAEDAPDLAGGERHRAQPAAAQRWRGAREVERLGFHAPGPRGSFDGALATVARIGHALDELVDHLAHLAARVRVGDLAEAAPVPGQLTVTSPEVSGPHGVERGEVLRRGDGFESLRRDAVDVGGHALVRAPRATSTSC